MKRLMMERTSSDEEPAAGSNRTACSITEVGRHDVLCGRGGKVMSHEGNILFRRAVEQRRAEYSSASKERKREIAQSILNDVQGRGGRFIQARAHVAGAYDRVSDSKALDKCFHALREKKSEAQQQKEKKETTESVKRGRPVPDNVESLCESLGIPASSISAPTESSISSEEQQEEIESDTTTCALLRSPEFMAELRLMSPEEKLEAMNDVFGKCCALEDHRRKQRRAATIDRSYLKSALEMMRREIDWIPDDCKRALLDAQTKCQPEELSDRRLEAFLRCVDWHPKRAAERFARYWEKRLVVFGPDKWLLPMTLSGALRDDLTAIRTGVGIALPHCDSSGRQLVWYPVAMNTFEGYTIDSLLRATWYFAEIACREGTEVVRLGNYKDATMRNIDIEGFSQHMEISLNCFPNKAMADHYILLPQEIQQALMRELVVKGKNMRVRTLFHDVESELLNRLASYGMTADVLPSDIGGKVELDVDEWIANRRKVEGKGIGTCSSEEKSTACHAKKSEEDLVTDLLDVDKPNSLFDDVLFPFSPEGAFDEVGGFEPLLEYGEINGGCDVADVLSAAGKMPPFQNDVPGGDAATEFPADLGRE